ncbi:hypothetical protein J1N35_045868 [Gossypium stocksii]|uniref:Peptidase A1 domain-containing protein n=1 Tax=Gossypium stocksii TaxID=47602 RepID=A0A9D3ZGU6_9ROSI|nr:hypothetical protein J1N35_045868 [Gossypium stocksii]
MAAIFRAWVVITVVITEAAVVGGFPATFKLERSIPLASHELELSELVERDRLRHGRLLESSSGGVVGFPVSGTYDPFIVGLYYTKLQLGSPPREFNVQIDTGSDVLWVGCNSCNGCPKSSGLEIPLNFFDPGSSSTASLVSCSDQRCSSGIQASDSSCSGSSNQCSYTFQYGDGSGTSGYYVSDLLHFNTILPGSTTGNATASIMFGCSMLHTGKLTDSHRAVDGIFGFGRQSLSVISQLSSQRVTPRTFSHCLKGDDDGGGILVLGEIVEPNMVYTPLVPSMPHYNLDLRSISVGGQVLSIDASVFSTSINHGAIIDSGTTLSYLADEAYNAFIDAIDNAVSEHVHPVLSHGNQCYLITDSIDHIFPEASLNFAGGVSLILHPEDYLIQQNPIGGSAVWCIGFKTIEGQKLTILGDLVMKDKIFVYDLEKQRIGWVKYDCKCIFSLLKSALRTVEGRSTPSGEVFEVLSTGQLTGPSTAEGIVPWWKVLCPVLYQEPACREWLP